MKTNKIAINAPAINDKIVEVLLQNKDKAVEELKTVIAEKCNELKVPLDTADLTYILRKLPMNVDREKIKTAIVGFMMNPEIRKTPKQKFYETYKSFVIKQLLKEAKIR